MLYNKSEALRESAPRSQALTKAKLSDLAETIDRALLERNADGYLNLRSPAVLGGGRILGLSVCLSFTARSIYSAVK